jgi:DNA-binding NtrC family response regulator
MTVALAVRSRAGWGGAAGETGGLLGVSPAILRLRTEIAAVARAGFRSILIQGESGVGKEIVAETLRRASTRAAAASEVFDCPAVPEDHLESELFGTARGAFPGALDKAGVLERAHGGTVFLDEIGAMRRDHQAKVLRAIEGKTFRRVGGCTGIAVDVAVIAAAHEDLAAMAARDLFRHDLFYRLTHDGVLLIPPLRERREDVAELVRDFADREDVRVTPAALDALTEHDWPGNVRQLRTVLRVARRLGEGALTNAAVEAALRSTPSPQHRPPRTGAPPAAREATLGDFQAVTARAQRRALTHAYESSGGNKTAAGILLGFHRSPGEQADTAPLTEARRNLALRKFRYWAARLGLSTTLTRRGGSAVAPRPDDSGDG